jgi:hypothetical protein
MIKLECKLVRFFSELDEISFTERIERIKCIESWEGVSVSIFLYVKSKRVSDVCLRELISLFYRYKIEMSQLSVFLNEKNKIWLMNNKAFWYKKMFKTTNIYP